MFFSQLLKLCYLIIRQILITKIMIPFSKQRQTVGFSNQLFAYYNENDTNAIHLYVPAYLRIKTKNIKSLQLEQLESEINLTIILSIYWYNMHPSIKEQMSRMLTISFRRNNVLLLQKGKNSQLTVDDSQATCLKFTIRKILKSRVVPYVNYTPLEILDQILTMSFKPFKMLNPYNEEKKLIIHINLMATEVLPKNSNIHVVMDQKGKIEHGGYALAEGRMFVQYTNKKLPTTLKYENQKQRKKKNFYVKLGNRPISFNYAHFHLPIYKQPEVSLLIIYLPLIILAILNISLFSTQPDLPSRLTNLATLMIAFVQLIPIIREQIPPTPEITLTQIIVVMQCLGAIFCLFSSIRSVGNQSEDIWVDPFFILTLIITLFVFFSPFVIYGYYVFHLKKSYQIQRQGKNMLDFFLFYNYNIDANLYFYKFVKQLQKQQFLNPGVKLISQFTMDQIKMLLEKDNQKEKRNAMQAAFFFVYKIVDPIGLKELQNNVKKIRHDKSLLFSQELKKISQKTSEKMIL